MLIVGGSARHVGGVEAVCERAAALLSGAGRGWRVERIATETAYLRPRRLPAFAGRLAALIRARRPDVVWLHYVNLPDLAFLLAARIAGRRVLVTPHLGANWASQRNAALRRLTTALLARADRLALISPTQAREIALPDGVPRSLVRNPLPEVLLTGAVPEDDGTPVLRLLHAARLSVAKGSLLAVEVARLLAARGIAVELTIAGAGDEAIQTALREAIARAGLGDRVRLVGRLEGEAMADLLRRSDALVHLSAVDSYPLILLEAMACGMLPVAMELAGARDMVERYDGHIVPVADAAARAADWLASLDLADLRARGCRAATAVRADYGRDRCVEAIDRALRAAIARDPDSDPEVS